MTVSDQQEEFKDQSHTVKYLSGIDALAELFIIQSERDKAAELKTAGFCSGYRGSPLSGFDQTLAQNGERLRAANVVFQPGLNEELSATAVWGSQQLGLADKASFDGVFAIWYAKAPGVDRAADALRHANFAGTHRHGGVLALLGDDHSCKSSTLPSFSEPIARHVAMPVLYPANVQDLIDLGALGFALSRYAGLWVGIKCLIDTMDASAPVDVSPDRVQITIPATHEVGSLGIRWPDPPLDQERRMFEAKLPAAVEFARANGINRVVRDDDGARIGVVTAGKSYLDTEQALDMVQSVTGTRMPVRLIKLGMVWPLDGEKLREFAAGLDEIMVVEEKAGLIEEQLRAVIYAGPPGSRPAVLGKADLKGRRLFPEAFELSSKAIATALAERWLAHERTEALQRYVERARETQTTPASIGLPARSPYFCAGCPHNTSTRVPEGSRALAGIGCHYMSQWMDRDTGFYSQMGGEGAAWSGLAPFVERRHVFANLGDGTFNHSGSLAIRAAVASRVSITYKILFNDAVAMTGGQPHDGQLSVPKIARLVLAEGVAAVHVVTDDLSRYDRTTLPPGVALSHRSELDAVQRQLREFPGVTVLIYDQGCATEKRRKRKKGELPTPKTRVFINSEVCEGCGDCGVQSNCVAIQPLETLLGQKRTIDQSACNKDYSCLKGFCPSFVTVDVDPPAKVMAGPRAPNALPGPALGRSRGRCYDIVVAGVGGTGVVSLGATIGRAAAGANRDVNVLDMIGMAQKGGQVISQIRVAGEGENVSSMRIPEGGAHLLLGCDALTSVSRDVLKFCGPSTVVVADATPIPSSDFTRNADYRFPGQAVVSALEKVVGRSSIHRVEATTEAIAEFGDAIFANTILLGFASQIGALPLPPAAFERAIVGFGSGGEKTLAAFDHGRALALHTAGNATPKRPQDMAANDLDSEIKAFSVRLAAYQDESYARRFETRIDGLRTVERVRCGTDTLSRAAARSLYRLMAYKDEYEVARLHVAFREELRAKYGAGVKINHHLAPPLLSRRDSAGHLRKRQFGSWIGFAFAVLTRLRRLRGTLLDPFAHTAERRQERELIERFLGLLDEIERDLSPERHAAGEKIARLGGEIRGFGHVKDTSLLRVEAGWEEALREFRTAMPQLEQASA